MHTHILPYPLLILSLNVNKHGHTTMCTISSCLVQSDFEHVYTECMKNQNASIFKENFTKGQDHPYKTGYHTTAYTRDIL